MALAVIWLPSLSRGFCGDDFLLVPVTLSQFVANPLWGAGAPPPGGEGLPVYQGEGRPVSTLTFALLPDQAFAQHAVSLLLYLGCLWMMWRLCQRLELAAWPTFFALSSFFHPAFLWNVTWIAHRYDLIVIAFLLFALLETRAPIKLALIALGSGAKPPLFFQNLVFGWEFARRGRMIAAAITLFWMIVFGIGVYVTRYTEESTVADSLYSLPSVVAIPLRIVKLAEGILVRFCTDPDVRDDAVGMVSRPACLRRLLAPAVAFAGDIRAHGPALELPDRRHRDRHATQSPTDQSNQHDPGVEHRRHSS